MLSSSVILLSLPFLSCVWCAPTSEPASFDAPRLARDMNIPSQAMTSTTVSQAPSFIGVLHSQPNAMSDSSGPVLVRPAAAAPPAPVDPPSSHVMNDSPRPLVMGYYPDWAGPDLPPEKIDLTRFDWIDFAFALPNARFDLGWDSEGAPGLLRRLVDVAHAENKKVKLSIGGWTGSQHFSPAVATDASMQTFIRNICQVYDDYHLDGIDIDWEYPGRQGANGNVVDSRDEENFLLFLRRLRMSLPPTARISAAASTVPFSIPGFCDELDWVLIMNYDVWQSSSNPGPNAPMYDGCSNSTQPDASAAAAFKAWTNHGCPSSKLVLGVPFYGYVSESNATGLRTRSDSPSQVTVKADDSQIRFSELVSQGALVRVPSDDPNGPASFVPAGGFERHWDSCSSTPFLRSSYSKQVISYDDTQSLEMKAQFARETGLLGINVFAVDGDTAQWDLTNSLTRGLRLSEH